MKKILLVYLFISLLVLNLPQPVLSGISSANMAVQPLYPFYEIAQIGNGDIIIEKETLTLRAANSEVLPDKFISEYTVKSNESMNAQIALPILGRITDTFDDYILNFNNTKITPQVNYSLKEYYSFENIDFTQNFLLNTYTSSAKYAETQCGTLYTFNSSAPYSVSFTLEKGQKVIYNGFAGSTYTQGVNIKTSAILSTSNVLIQENTFKSSVFVTEGALTLATTADPQIDTVKLSYNDYLSDFDVPECPYLYPYASNAFNVFLNGYDDITSAHELLNNSGSIRVIFLIYNIEIKNSINQLVIERPIPAFYAWENPAAYRIINSSVRTFSSFGHTEIKINTNKLPSIDETSFEQIAKHKYYFCSDLTSYDEYKIILNSIDDINNGNNKNNNNNRLMWLILAPILSAVCLASAVIVIYQLKFKRISRPRI